MVTTVAAFDDAWNLLCAAARAGGTRAIHDVRADANLGSVAPHSFDVVVNVPAVHHVQDLGRRCRILCEALKN